MELETGADCLHAKRLIPLPARLNPSENSCISAPVQGSVGLISMSSSSLGWYTPPTSLHGVSCSGLRQVGLPEHLSHVTPCTEHHVHQQIKPIKSAHPAHSLPLGPLAVGGPPGVAGGSRAVEPWGEGLLAASCRVTRPWAQRMRGLAAAAQVTLVIGAC